MSRLATVRLSSSPAESLPPRTGPISRRSRRFSAFPTSDIHSSVRDRPAAPRERRKLGQTRHSTLPLPTTASIRTGRFLHARAAGQIRARLTDQPAGYSVLSGDGGGISPQLPSRNSSEAKQAAKRDGFLKNGCTQRKARRTLGGRRVEDRMQHAFLLFDCQSPRPRQSKPVSCWACLPGERL
jgi:hypothetical protein